MSGRRFPNKNEYRYVDDNTIEVKLTRDKIGHRFT